MTVYSCTDRNEVTDAAVARFVDVITSIQTPRGGIHEDGIARVVLTGGTAGIEFCEKLGRLAVRDDCPIEWSRIYFYFGDERNVATTHPDSNEGQAAAVLFDRAPIPAEHVFGYGLGGKLSLPEAVARYEKILSDTAPRGFDIHLLGMGGEGHINSLFPHTEATRTTGAAVTMETQSPKPPAERVTLTLPAVQSARRVWLLVSGEDKAEAVTALLEGAQPDDLPAVGAIGQEETIVFTDQA